MCPKICDFQQRNSGHDKPVVAVTRFVHGEGLQLLEQRRPNHATVLRYCPVMSVDVKRSFSAYKRILTDKRQGPIPENIEKQKEILRHTSRDIEDGKKRNFI
jgi:hypothetical protein